MTDIDLLLILWLMICGAVLLGIVSTLRFYINNLIKQIKEADKYLKWPKE